MDKKAIWNSRPFLYITEFFAGMSVMAVELGASRLLAPYFSSSQIVWTIIIGTIMIAMALGNIYGGRKADKDPDPRRLYRRILIAAIWIAAIPVLGKYVILGISALLIFTVNSHFLIIAAFASCIVVFVFPLFLLGTVTPSLAKYTTRSLDDNGRIIGSLGAFNTVGSIIGTFLPTFVTIPAVGTAVTFLLFSGMLLVVALIYFISTHTAGRRIVVGIVVFLVCCVLGHSGSFAFWETGLAYEGESVYNYLQVKETDRAVILSTNVLFGVQSIHIKDGSLTGMYYDYALAAPYMCAARERAAAGEETDVLILGMGSGTYATQLSRYFPELTVEGVEIDPKITKLAYEYFELPETTKVTTYDGRAYLAAVDEAYDVIMVDAYQDITIPFQMSTVEFFTMVREHLAPGGVLVVNMNMRSEGPDQINAYLADTIAAVFPYVMTVDVPGTTNRELFASESADCCDTLLTGVWQEEDLQLQSLMLSVASDLRPYEAGNHVMTDDKAPVELLGMRQIDALIAGEVEQYRALYEEDGIAGLLESL